MSGAVFRLVLDVSDPRRGAVTAASRVTLEFTMDSMTVGDLHTEAAEVSSGRYRAREQFEAALKQAQEIGYERGIIRSLYKLGDVAHALSDDHEALAHYRAALQTARAIGATPLAVDAVLGLAAMARDAGHYERAMTSARRRDGTPFQHQRPRDL